jgi:uncharacterized protein YciI
MSPRRDRDLAPILVLACALAVLGPAGCAARAPAPATPAARPFKMRTYQLALLRRGPAWSPERTPAVEALGRGHMANIRRLGMEGSLLIAGPFEVPEGAPADALVGLFIFDVTDRAEAEALVATDPTIQAGHFKAELIEWFGPAGLTYDGREAELSRLRAGSAAVEP